MSQARSTAAIGLAFRCRSACNLRWACPMQPTSISPPRNRARSARSRRRRARQQQGSQGLAQRRQLHTARPDPLRRRRAGNRHAVPRARGPWRRPVPSRHDQRRRRPQSRRELRHRVAGAAFDAHHEAMFTGRTIPDRDPARPGNPAAYCPRYRYADGYRPRQGGHRRRAPQAHPVGCRKPTRRDRFLAEMHTVVPREKLTVLIEPMYANGDGAGPVARARCAAPLRSEALESCVQGSGSAKATR